MLTIEEVQKDIATYQKRLANPAGLSEREIAVYQQAIVEATFLLEQMQAAQHGPVTPPPTPPPHEQIKHTTPPPPSSTQLSESFKLSESSRQTLPPPTPPPHQPPINQSTNHQFTIRTPGAQKISKPIPAIIEADLETNPFNPVVKIIWDDGYTFSGDESTIKGMFISRLWDCANLKDAKDPYRRQKQMWSWNTPWRCLGLFQAIIYFYGGQAPTLQQLGVDMRRVSNLFLELFQLITHTALAADSGKTTVK